MYKVGDFKSSFQKEGAHIRDYVRILIPRGLLVMDCLFLLLFSFLNPQIPGGAKAPSAPPLT